MAEPKPKRPRLAWSDRASFCVAGALSGIITLLAFPPFAIWPLAFLAPLPLVWAAHRINAGKWGAAAAATIGIAPVWAWEQQWMFGVSALGAPLLVLYLSLYTGAFVWIALWTRRRLGAPAWLLGPVIYAGLETLRGTVVGHGYPWMLAGHPLIDWPAFAAAAAVLGASGVSFLVVTLGMAVYGLALARGRQRLTAAVILILSAATIAICATRTTTITEGTLRVAVVQTNVAQDVKLGWPPPERMRDLDRMLELSVQAAESDPTPDLIVWPETMFPGAALDADSLNEERAADLSWVTDADAAWPAFRFLVYRGPLGIDTPVPVSGPFERNGRLMIPTTVASDSLLAWQERLAIPFLVGAEGVEGLRLEVDPNTGAVSGSQDARFNSTYLIEQGRVQGDRYDKMHLTPFGEVMPYISAWPWLEQTLLNIGVGAGGLAFDLDAGEQPTAHAVRAESGLARIATPICFEGIMPATCRRLVYSGGERTADLLVQVTNDGWFADFDPGRDQHLLAVRWRAVELGTAIVRAANTGVSALILPDGSLAARGVQAGDHREDGLLIADAPLASGSTPYASLGDLLAWANLAGLGAVLLASALRGKARPQSPAPAQADEER